MRIITVVGARPQFVKAGVVSRVLRSTPEIEEIFVNTGQHYDLNLSQVFFVELGIPAPAYDLGVGSGSHGSQTGRMLVAIEQVLLKEKPDCVLVYGDTNSTLAGALAAAKLCIPVAHVEAGLRSFNRAMPEEINRVLTDHVSDLLFAPTELASTNLCREGIAGDRVKLSGDVMYDAALYHASQADQQSTILDDLKLKAKDYILATVHRAENTDDPARLRAIMTGLGEVATKIPVVFPIHPRTRRSLTQQKACARLTEKIRFIDPVGYLDMTMLEKNALLIATDSGGVQKEAFFFSVPCVTLRAETEWQELVDLGWNRLVPPGEFKRLTSTIEEVLATIPGTVRNPYGDGHAACRIVDHLVAFAQERFQRGRSLIQVNHAIASDLRQVSIATAE